MAPPRRRDDENFLPEVLTPPPSLARTPPVIDYCSARVAAELSWPQTHRGHVAKQPCPPGTIGETDTQV